MSEMHSKNKRLLEPLRKALYDWQDDKITDALSGLCTTDVVFRLCHPFGELHGWKAFKTHALDKLRIAWPDVERRDWIVIAGQDEDGANWVGCGGHFVGTFTSPFLDIPPTGHLTHMRFHEFFRISDGKVTEYQGIWDIPEVMIQAGAWPLAPSLGREFCVPGPATCDGLSMSERDQALSDKSCNHIIEMLDYMTRHPSMGGPEVMEMDRFWAPNMNWYGPAGIGTGRGIAGFRNWHQIPFLSGMPDRGQYVDEIKHHFFGDNNYAAVTGWPNMMQTVSHDGWLGIAPSGKRITMRSLDFWRIENGKIRENWVLVDILDAYQQLGVDVFARLREFNKARVPGSVPFPVGAA